MLDYVYRQCVNISNKAQDNHLYRISSRKVIQCNFCPYQSLDQQRINEKLIGLMDIIQKTITYLTNFLEAEVFWINQIFHIFQPHQTQL